MALNKKLLAFIENAKQGDSYWVEKAKLGFAMALERWRRDSGLSNTELAAKIGTSPAYITKVFRGDTNFTIETMSKLARACGGQLDIQIIDTRAQASRWAHRVAQERGGETSKGLATHKFASSSTTETVNTANPWFGTLSPARNDEQFVCAA